MANNNNMLQLCRLCLVKDDVNIPIFEEQGDIRQIFLKISSCLPVKVSREDRLPKKICDGCSYKLDMLYEFWNTSANAEKQLLSWLGEAGVSSKMADGAISAVAQQMRPAEVKEETLEPDHLHNVDEDDKDYLFEQQRVVEAAAAAGPSATVTSNDEEEPPPKRARRTAAVKAAIAMDQDSDDDDDSGEPLTKIEDESDDSEGEDHVPAFVDVPSTSADDQPGPSGVGKEGVEAPSTVSYSCEECDSHFKTYYNLIRHLMTTHVETPHQCDVCNETFSKLQLLRAHKKQVHSEVEPERYHKKYSCNQCDASFTCKNRLKYHHESVHLGVTYLCEHCPKVCSTIFTYREHVKTHKPGYEKRIFLCEKCPKRYLRARVLNKHMQVHHTTEEKEYRYQCERCPSRYLSNEALRYHAFMKHSGEAPTFVCDYCGKTVVSMYSLQNHLRIHTGEMPFHCDLCPKKFKTSLELKSHKVSHTDEKPYECTVCNKSFKLRSYLQHHKKMHCLPFGCTICSKTFKTEQALEEHYCNHDKPFKCDVCGVGSTSKQGLGKHMMIHTGEKPYSCDICSKDFRQKSALTTHRRTHTGERPFQCVTCMRTFMSHASLGHHNCKM